MSKFAWAGLLGGGSLVATGALLAASALAQTSGSPPDFSSAGTSWSQGNGVNFMPVPGSASPIANDPAHPHYSNGEAIRRGIQPTYRIADLTNPNIKSWAKDVMKKDNDEVLAGKFAYTPGSSCRPAGTPVFMLDGGPFYFVQTPRKSSSSRRKIPRSATSTWTCRIRRTRNRPGTENRSGTMKATRWSSTPSDSTRRHSSISSARRTPTSCT
jgi:hypothetical protein